MNVKELNPDCETDYQYLSKAKKNAVFLQYVSNAAVYEENGYKFSKSDEAICGKYIFLFNPYI